jgi:hypothetical protein
VRGDMMLFEGWAKGLSGVPAGGLEDMRLCAELLRERKVLYFDGLLKIALAEAALKASLLPPQT